MALLRHPVFTETISYQGSRGILFFFALTFANVREKMINGGMSDGGLISLEEDDAWRLAVRR